MSLFEERLNKYLDAIEDGSEIHSDFFELDPDDGVEYIVRNPTQAMVHVFWRTKEQFPEPISGKELDMLEEEFEDYGKKGVNPIRILQNKFPELGLGAFEYQEAGYFKNEERYFWELRITVNSMISE